jgi:hypothetical protein
MPRLGWFVVVSLLVLSPLPFLNARSTTGALSRDWSDHLHHAFATWVFLHKGVDVYRQPLSESWEGVKSRQRNELWGHMPLNYPPGILLVFLPVAILGETLPVSARMFGALGVWWMLFFAHLAWGAAVWATRAVEPRGSRWVAWGFLGLVLVRLGLEGFYDPVWIFAAGLGVWALEEERPGAALLWFSAAVLLHYRAVVLLPLGVYALAQVLKGRTPSDWPWGVLCVCGVAVLLSLGSFLLMYPATAVYRAATHDPVWSHGNLFRQVALPVLSSAALAAVAWRRHWSVALSVAVCCGLALVDVRSWWHASVMVVPFLAAGLFPKRGARGLELGMVVWWVLLERQIWGADYPTQVLWDLLSLLG